MVGCCVPLVFFARINDFGETAMLVLVKTLQGGCVNEVVHFYYGRFREVSFYAVVGSCHGFDMRGNFVLCLGS